MSNFEQQTATQQTRHMEQYYRWQSRIYDATRWSFLFGRKALIQALPLRGKEGVHIAEIGCGTGYNLTRLAKRFPEAKLTGLDVSPDMIRLSQKRTQPFGDRVQLRQQPYGRENSPFDQPLDAILFSYSLTMINPQWSELLDQALLDLHPGGYIGVVDFHDSAQPWFKAHMSNHHVRMDGHLLPQLRRDFVPVRQKVGSAYLGVWQYLLFIGQKKA